MKNNTLRLTALALGSLLMASCGSTKPNKETKPGQDLDSGPSRYLQEPTTTQTQTQTQPENPANTTNPDPAAPQPPVTENKTANTPAAPETPTPPAPTTPQPAKPAAELPFGKPVPGKKGFVTSPYDGSAGIIDVRDIPPGTKVRDPYTGKVFRVP